MADNENKQEDDMPELENQEGDSKQFNRGEKKCRKALMKQGMKALSGITRVTLKKRDGLIFVIDDPEEHLPELARTLRHELTHAALFTLGAPLPTWLHEGLAQQVEGADVGFARARLVAQGQWFLAPEELSGDWTVWRDQDRVREAYFYSLSLATWLGDEFGGTVWGNLFQNLRGRSFQEAWQLTFGASWDAVEARHRLTLS